MYNNHLKQATAQIMCLLLPDRISLRMSGAIKRRLSLKMKTTIKSGEKNLKMVMCRTATLPSTATTGRGTD